MIAPAFDALASRYANRAVFLRVDVDKNSDVSRAAGVTVRFILVNNIINSFFDRESGFTYLPPRQLFPPDPISMDLLCA